ncbi:hypothetical protein ANN_23656 [Periplaneta americana]|uniref:Uncharacterized protein n=1 Tax=Periplaneta americana TaxID=6978 RepID=A0ABQ8SMY5_PERAM|nr:hypothetical protein ANN_23656 [Periplaneta americana]
MAHPTATKCGYPEQCLVSTRWGAAHFALAVRQHLNAVFRNRWISRGSNNDPASLPWPPRSPDLTTPGYIKEQVWKADKLLGRQYLDVIVLSRRTSSMNEMGLRLPRADTYSSQVLGGVTQQRLPNQRRSLLGLLDGSPG